VRPVVTPLLCAARHRAFVVRCPPSPSSFAVRHRAFVGRARESRADPVARIAGGFTRGPGPSARIAGLHARAWTSAVARVAPSSADPTRRARPVLFTRTRRGVAVFTRGTRTRRATLHCTRGSDRRATSSGRLLQSSWLSSWNSPVFSGTEFCSVCGDIPLTYSSST
jgi:hypothetical protein